MLRDDRLLVARGQDVPPRLRNHFTEVLVCWIQDAIFDLILDRIECPDVMTGDTDLTSFISRVERHSIDMNTLPFGTSNDSRLMPVEDDYLRIDFIGHGDDDHVVVAQGREVEIDDNLWLRLWCSPCLGLARSGCSTLVHWCARSIC